MKRLVDIEPNDCHRTLSDHPSACLSTTAFVWVLLVSPPCPKPQGNQKHQLLGTNRPNTLWNQGAGLTSCRISLRASLSESHCSTLERRVLFSFVPMSKTPT